MTHRVLLAVLAVAACGWLATGRQSARELDRAQAIVKTRGSAEQPALAREALADYSAAARRSPDTKPEVLRAALLLRTGRDNDARRELESVLTREPDNFDAWTGLAIVAGIQRDTALALRAQRERRRLNPLRVRAARAAAAPARAA